MQHNIYEAKARLSELVAAALAGDEVTIARNGEPMVRLVPIGQPQEADRWLGRGFGVAQGLFDVPEDFDEPLPDDLLRAFYA